MFTINTYEYDCTKKCQSRAHGRIITSAVSKRSVSDDNLIAFIAKSCRNFAENVDFEGRNALHLASSVGRYAVVEWLLNNGAPINNKDQECGNTALHRAIFYGCIDCAVLLLKYGANIYASNNDFRSPLQQICTYNKLDIYREIPRLNELLVWGRNRNFNLGTTSGECTKIPQFIDEFRKQNISIQNLSMSMYHTVFLDNKGELWVVGHGNGGRLGTGNENSLPVPARIKIPFKYPDDRVLCISCSKNHTLVLTKHGTVYVTGLNNDQQLGLKPPPDKLTSFREISTLNQFTAENLISVIARDRYSVAYNSRQIFTWGANQGMFGIDNSMPHITQPRQMQTNEKIIKAVDANDSAIAVYTSVRQILLFYNYKVKVIKTPGMEPLSTILLTGGESSTKKKKNTLQMLALTILNEIYIWFEEQQQYIRCACSHSLANLLQITKILFRNNNLIILCDGNVYEGAVTKIPLSNNASLDRFQDAVPNVDVSTKFRGRLELKRIPHIDRAVDIFCCIDFESFAVLQENSRQYFLLPKLMAEEYTFKNLLHEVSEFDTVHDIVFHIDHGVFPAHKFIIFSRAKGLMELARNTEHRQVDLDFNGLTGKMFELILKHIYTNYFLSLEDFDDIIESLGPEICIERLDVFSTFCDFCKKFGLHDLAKYLKCSYPHFDGIAAKQKHRFNRLTRLQFPELYDVTIKCADNKLIRAHKCILVSRLEYFNIMFNNSWSENTVINFNSIPVEYMLPIIDFLYTLDVDDFRKQKYSESFLYNMIVICDQFFMNRLRRVCEILLLERISIRKCAEMIEFACLYNCETMERGCMEFVCQNLARILEQKSLENCTPKTLTKLNDFYRNVFSDILSYRLITPYTDAISDEELTQFISNFEVSLENKTIEEDNKGKPKLKSKPNKSVLSKRIYERDAINRMRNLSVETVRTSTTSYDIASILERNAEEISNRYQAQANGWMKVQDKKETKKKSLVVAQKINEILKAEEKPKDDFTNISQCVKSPPNLGKQLSTMKLNSNSATEKNNKEMNSISSAATISRSHFNLGDCVVRNDKLSQKQRKRLSSTSNDSKTETLNSVTSPIPIPTTSNVWATRTSPSTSFDCEHSFADIIKTPNNIHSSPENIKSPETVEKSNMAISLWSSPTSTNLPITSPKSARESLKFSKIVEDERRQKEYLVKLKSKSLMLTQIEEAAIDELKNFYNTDNVFDENIAINRRSVEVTMNFATWQHSRNS